MLIEKVSFPKQSFSLFWGFLIATPLVNSSSGSDSADTRFLYFFESLLKLCEIILEDVGVLPFNDKKQGVKDMFIEFLFVCLFFNSPNFQSPLMVSQDEQSLQLKTS